MKDERLDTLNLSQLAASISTKAENNSKSI
jgi:hypothetical protein